MSTQKESIKVSIMQREFTVACSEEESQSVIEAAAYLDRQMRAVSGGAQVLGIDRCAIMAGLNISHELLELRKSADNGEQMNARLESLNRRIEEVVGDAEQARVGGENK